MSAAAPIPDSALRTPHSEFEPSLRALVDMYEQADWERMESLADALMHMARRKRLEAAANSAGIINHG